MGTSLETDPRMKGVLSVSISLGVLSLVVVALRFASRYFIRKKVSLDDWLILLAWLLGLAIAIPLCIASSVKNKHIRRRTRLFYSFFYDPAMAMVKNSVLVYYMNLFKSYKSAKWLIWGLLVVINSSAFAFSIIILFQCRPFRVIFMTYSDPLPRGWKCLDTVKLVYAAAPLHIVTDFGIILLPMPMLSALQLPMKQKVMLMFIFGSGGLVAVLQVVRSYQFSRAAKDPIFGWDGIISYLWALVTVYVGIITASAPMLKPIIMRAFPRLLRDFASVQSNSVPGAHSDTGSIRNSTSLHGTPTSASQNTLSHPVSVDVFGDVPIQIRPRRRNNLSIELYFSDFSTTQKALPMICLISGPFLMRGFSYGLLDIMHKMFEALRHTTESQAIGMHTAYYGSEALSALTLGSWILRRYGFKYAISAGLFIFGVGCMSFWPSSIEHSLAGIIVSMLLVGSGCGLLEAACHPFVALIGPQDYAEVRINILQGIQAVGGLLMLLIETTQLYASIGIQSYSTLFNIQWVFLACGFTSFIIAGIFCCVNLPELKEYEPSFKVSSYMLFCGRYRTSFILALVAMFFYVGGQEVTTLYSRKYLVYGIKDDDATALKSEKGAQALFAIGRFLGAALMLTFRPTAVLFFYILGLVATSAICLAANGALANASYNFNLFFQSISFPTIFIISLRGTGADILTASSYLTSTVSGAAVVSSLYWVIEKSKGDKFAVCVLCMAVFSVMILHPVYITLSRSERERTKRVDRSVCEEDGREVVGGGSGRWVEGTLRCAGMCGARRTRKRTDGVVGFGNFSTTEPGSEGT